MVNLPLELVQKICTYLCEHCVRAEGEICIGGWPTTDGKALASLCRVSKLWYQAAQPVLYHSLAVTSVNHPIASSLIRTIIQRPELGRAVKTLDIGFVSFCMSQETVEIAGDDLELFNAEAVAAGIDLPEQWRGTEQRSSILVQLLLCHIPKLQTLTVADEPEFRFELLPGRVLLPELKTLGMHRSDDPEGGFNPSDVLPLLNASPNITTLALHYCTGASDSLRFDNVTKVILSMSYMDSEGINQLVASCSKLETFVYQSGGLLDELLDEVTPTEIVEALRQHASTLRNLSVSFAPECIDALSDYVEDLEDFTCLERLMIPTEAFSDGDDDQEDIPLLRSLPPSLQELHLDSDPRHVWKDLVRLAGLVAEGDYPNLQVVGTGNEKTDMLRNVEQRLGIGDSIRQADRKIRDAFARVGIKPPGKLLDPVVEWGHMNVFCGSQY